MSRFVTGAILALSLLGAAAPLFGDDKIKESDVPKPAIEAVKKKYPAAKLTGFEKEGSGDKVVYEVALEDGARKIEVELSADGKILVEEEAIALEAVPKEVKKGLADSKYGKWTLKKAERVVTAEKADAPTYELYLVDGDKRAEAEFDKSGKLVKSEDKKGKDDDDDDDDDEEDDD